jgi:hypothetical protein
MPFPHLNLTPHAPTITPSDRVCYGCETRPTILHLSTLGGNVSASFCHACAKDALEALCTRTLQEIRANVEAKQARLEDLNKARLEYIDRLRVGWDLFTALNQWPRFIQ